MRVISQSVSSQTDLRISPVETPEIRIRFGRLDDEQDINIKHMLHKTSSFIIIISIHLHLLVNL